MTQTSFFRKNTAQTEQMKTATENAALTERAGSITWQILPNPCHHIKYHFGKRAGAAEGRHAAGTRRFIRSPYSQRPRLPRSNFFLTSNAAMRTMCPVAQIAQSVEQVIENHRVTGSIPVPGTISEPA